MALQSSGEANILDRFEQALDQAGLTLEALDLRRLAELRANLALAITQNDKDICHLIEHFRVLNVCGIQRAVKIDQAHDPINKERYWRDRYANLRRTQQQRQPVTAEPSITVLNPSDLNF